MNDKKLSPEIFQQLDAYFSKRVSENIENFLRNNKKNILEKNRLSPEKKAENEKRILQEIARVASGAPISKPSIDVIWASTGNIAAPDSSQKSEGWSVNTPPESYFFNYLFNLIEQYLLYINQRGICEWDSTTEYPLFAYTVASDGNVYQSIIANNTANDPTTNDTAWQQLVSPTAYTAVIQQGVAQAIPLSSGVEIKIDYDNAIHDFFALYNSNGGFTIKKAGLYFVGALCKTVSGVGAPVDAFFHTRLYKNNVANYLGNTTLIPAGKADITVSCGAVIQLAKNDVLENHVLLVPQTGSSFQNISIGGDNSTNYFYLNYLGV